MVLLRNHLSHHERTQTPRPLLILPPKQPCREGFPALICGIANCCVGVLAVVLVTQSGRSLGYARNMTIPALPGLNKRHRRPY
jgi:hypothetical protein